MKNELVSADDGRSPRVDAPEQRYAEVYREYQRRLLEASAVDFDDLLLLTVRLFRDHPDVLARWQHRFASRARRRVPGHQRRAVGAGPPPHREHRNVMVVGDADQAVYGFRGRRLPQPHALRGGVPRRDRDRARAELPLDPGHPRRRQRGDRQQRGPSAQASVDRADRRRAHHPLPGRGRARRGRVRACTRSAGSSTPRTTASATSRSSTARTRRAASSRRRSSAPGVPYRVVGGVKFYDRREVKDVLAYLRGAREPRRRGELEADRQHARSAASATRRSTEVGRVRAGRGHHVPRRARVGGRRRRAPARRSAGIRDLLELMTRCRGGGRRAASRPTVEAVLEHTGYLAELEAERSIEAAGPHREPAGARRGVPRVRPRARRRRPHRAARHRRASAPPTRRRATP